MSFRYITPQAIVARRFGTDPLPKWEAAVLCFRDSRGSQIAVEVFDARPVGRKMLYGLDEWPGAPFVYEAEIDGRPVGIVTRCLWGGAQAAIFVEELAAMGVRVQIGIGAAGALDASLLKGTQLFASKALATCGTSRTYAPDAASFAADLMLSELLRNRWPDMRGTTAATVDALYRETEELLRRWEELGAQMVNMETSAFYAAASACGVRSVWLGHVSDHLRGSAWDDWFGDRDAMSAETARRSKELLRLFFRAQ